ncbi:MAG: NFACT family protein [Eubacterium sp.]|nr:NFACT family protein [Eubacterium sp.]
MALDGAFLHCIVKELADMGLVGGRVDKIHQPSKDEIVLALRGGGKTVRILISAASDRAGIYATERRAENPAAPPMFCMLLRKHLGSGKLLDIAQDGLERIVNFDFECVNEIGDTVLNRLTVELMGRYSNIILMTKRAEGEPFRVTDSLRRVTDEVSSVRRILPGIVYEVPPRDLSRLNLLTCTADDVKRELCVSGQRLSRLIVNRFEGVSPLFGRECCYYALRDTEAVSDSLDGDRLDRLMFFIKKARGYLTDGGGYTVLKTAGGAYKEFCFMPVEQYGAQLISVPVPTANALLDSFYGLKAENERVKQRSAALLKTLLSSCERISRKLGVQRQELEGCLKREEFRVCGDIISANIYRMEKGADKLTAENYYTGETVTVELDPKLSPSQNAQKYYAQYRRMETAEKMLTKLISDGEKELTYIESVFDAASRAGSDAEISEIREELRQNGYLKGGLAKKGASVKPKAPIHFVTDDGYDVYVGRNNLQNDRLTLKESRGDDMWLHTKDIPGSHVIIKAKDGEVSDNAILQAASLAAYCSKAQNSTKVPVDYTRVKYVKKPGGAKPGMVIFSNNYTVLVDPDAEAFARAET